MTHTAWAGATTAATTIPAVRSVVRGVRRARRHRIDSGVGFDDGLIGVTRYPRKGDDDRA